MSDIVERLRDHVANMPMFPSAPWRAMHEAADEIERLQRELDAALADAQRYRALYGKLS